MAEVPPSHIFYLSFEEEMREAYIDFFQRTGRSLEEARELVEHHPFDELSKLRMKILWGTRNQISL